jgi:hypothetical protein
MLPANFNPGKTPVIYFVLRDLGELGLVWAEREVGYMDRKTTFADMAAGQFDIVRQVIEVEFTDAGISSRDVTEEFVLARVDHQLEDHREANRLFQLDHERDYLKHEAA